jgi:hypothetical protein
MALGSPPAAAFYFSAILEPKFPFGIDAMLAW